MKRAFSLGDISIRSKIAAILMTLVLIMGVTGAFSVNRIMRVNQTAVDINTNWLPSVRYIGELRYNMARHRAIISRHMMVSEAAEKDQVESRVRNAEKNVENARKKYETMLSPASERAAYDEFVPIWNAYLAASARMLEVSTRGDNAAAMKMFVKEVSAVGLKAEASLDKIVEINLAGADAAANGGTQLYVTSRNLLAASIALAILFACAAGYLLVVGVARPVRGMTEAMTRLAGGELDVQIPAAGQRDEIGRMADAVEIFRQQAIVNRQQAEREKEAEVEAVETRKQTILQMAATVEGETSGAIAAIELTARDVDMVAQDMSKFAASVSLDTQSVAAASEQALANSETVAAAAEELSSSIQEIAAQVARTAAIAQGAVASGEAAARTVQSLTEAVARISAVTKLIGDIASQTNLLALNATIEAARAGEAGRGFAVVASEVKGLASQTARSTEDINLQIAEIQTVTAAAVRAMSEVGSRIHEIDGAAAAIADSIQQQGQATREIARNVSQTTIAAREVSARIQSVSAGVLESDLRAKSVRSSIAEVNGNISSLRETLVRVVRTSTADANRRMSSRYEITARADILTRSGTRQPCELIDISENGARVRCEPGMEEVRDGAIRIRGLDHNVQFVVRSRDADNIRIELCLAEDQVQPYRRSLDAQVGRSLNQAS